MDKTTTLRSRSISRRPSGTRSRRVSTYTSATTDPPYTVQLEQQNEHLRSLVDTRNGVIIVLGLIVAFLFFQSLKPTDSLSGRLGNPLHGSSFSAEVLKPKAFADGKLTPEVKDANYYAQLPAPFPKGMTPGHFGFIFKEPFEVFNLDKRYNFTAGRAFKSMTEEERLRIEAEDGPIMNSTARQSLVAYLLRPWQDEQFCQSWLLSSDYCVQAQKRYLETADYFLVSTDGHDDGHVRGKTKDKINEWYRNVGVLKGRMQTEKMDLTGKFYDGWSHLRSGFN